MSNPQSLLSFLKNIPGCSLITLPDLVIISEVLVTTQDPSGFFSKSLIVIFEISSILILQTIYS
ncbi:MAG: hypothetical protein BWX58_01288 [Deltaproteobacteria bacterium ADurb.Bin026]|nr:MAG: hypothetical protein BWX58_01288 [Deltaproteobacteria bacterium ADurb.Bin026]